MMYIAMQGSSVNQLLTQQTMHHTNAQTTNAILHNMHKFSTKISETIPRKVRNMPMYEKLTPKTHKFKNFPRRILLVERTNKQRSVTCL